MTFDWIADRRPQHRGRGRPARLSRNFTRDDASGAILLARRILIEDPEHNPILAEALVMAADLVESPAAVTPERERNT